MVTLLLIVLAIVLLSATGWLYKRDLIARAAVMLWMAFVPYEIWFRSHCTGECNIRADLVLLLPILLVVSLAAMASAAHKALQKRKVIVPAPDGASEEKI